MNRWGHMWKKSMAIVLSATIVCSSMEVMAGETGVQYISETVDLGGIEERDGSLDSIDITDSTVALIEGNATEWIDRINLPEEMKELYVTLEEGADNDGEEDILIEDTYFEEGKIPVMTVTTNSELSDTKKAYIYNGIRAVIDAFDRDHPEVFWLSGYSRAGYSGTITTSGGMKTYRYTFYMYLVDEESEYDIRSESYRNEESIKAGISSLNTCITSIKEGIGEDANRLEIIQYFNTYLTENNEYNTSANLNAIDASCRESTSALLGSEGTAGPVCEGYARAFKVLCDASGIPCVLVDGNAKTSATSSGVGHMWNYVCVDENWYGVDVTWNDPQVSGITGKKSGYEREDYLLVGSENKIGDMKFIESHPVENKASTEGVRFTNGPTLSGLKYVPSLRLATKPGISGIYGTVADMTLTEGVAKYADLEVSGSWEVAKEDLNTLLVPGTTQTITVNFTATGEDAALGTLSCEVLPEVGRKSLRHEDVSINLLSQKFTYDGTGKTPEVTVEDVAFANKLLEKDTDYTVAYRNNINAGDTASVIITGIGNYEGEIEKIFTIDKGLITTTIEDINRSYPHTKGSDGEVSIGLAGLLPSDAGNITYSVGVEGNILKGVPKVLDNNLIFEVNPGELNDAAVITVAVVSENYQQCEIKVNVSLTAEEEVQKPDETPDIMPNEKVCAHAAGRRGVRNVTYATCKKEGYTGDIYCKDCNAVIKAGTVTAKTDIHTWNKGTVTTAPTAKKKGVKKYTCVLCGKIKTESVKALGAPKKGTVSKDDKHQATYKVTKSGLTGGTVEYVKPVNNKTKKVTIPATVKIDGITYKVTSIAKNAFKGNKKLTQITLGKNVAKIGTYAFYGCKYLKSITIQTTKLTTKNVGKNAFKGIYNKATIKVPKAKLNTYKKLLRNRGVTSKAKIKK